MRMTMKIKIAAMLVAAGTMCATGCSKKSAPANESAGAPSAAAAQNKPGGPGGAGQLKTATVETRQISLKREYIGEVAPAYSVEARGTASGWLANLKVDIGSRVAAGQELCRIDNEELKAQAEQARAGIAAAEFALARAEAALEQVGNEAARAESLYSKGYISQRELESAQSTRKQHKASVDAARAQLDQATAQLKTAQSRLNDTAIRAPFSGVVAERYLDNGAYVSPSSAILRLIDDSEAKVVINAVEEDVPWIKIGADAEVTVDAWPGRSFSAKVKRVSPSIDRNSRTGAVEIILPNKSGDLRTGMTARVRLTVAHKEQALTLPAGALKSDAGATYVMLKTAGEPERREVQTGIKTSESVEILSGLTEGDVVVVAGTSAGGRGNR
ncbi:MAG TPA: efflux RND transporter periplasmic adaptor subunit [bacterium]|nr:efflux RND transporter periplasmic adaptor subunit [bacterium]